MRQSLWAARTDPAPLISYSLTGSLLLLRVAYI